MGDPTLIDAVRNLIIALVGTFGTWGSVVLIGAIVAVTAGWRVYQDWRKDREVHLALAEKEAAVQRLARENRELKHIVFKKVLEMSDQEIERILVKDLYLDGQTRASEPITGVPTESHADSPRLPAPKAKRPNKKGGANT